MRRWPAPLSPLRGRAEPVNRVDILLPVYNNRDTIEQSVRSMLAQSFRDFRLIVVDDGSTDGTSEVLARLASTDERMVVITTPNRGIVDALNTGLEHSRAPLLARHDGDDLAFPHRLEQQVRYLDEHSDCVAVSSNVWHIDWRGERIGRTRFHGDATGDSHTIPAHEPYLMHPFLTVRSSVIRQVGGYRHVLHAEDTDLYWRLEPLGRLHICSDYLGEYRLHADSVTSRSMRNVRAAAVFSQLSALSARRRRAGLADLQFTKGFAEQVNGAATLAGMIAVASHGLDEEERSYLEVAAAAKMLQLRIFRQFHFAGSDLRTMLRAFTRHYGRIPPRQRRTLLSMPFWYYYRPRKYLRALRAMLRLPSLRG